jgi:hypothetical protein
MSANLFLGFLVNFLVALAIVRGIYYPARHDKNNVFTFLAFNTVIYFVMTFLATAELSVGVGFGLFAIFSVLRYRTGEISTREMTYLFILIALPVMNSVLMTSGAWPVLAASNAIVLAVIYVLEQGWGFRYESVKSIKYDRLEMIAAQQEEALLAELRGRTGLPITRCEIGRINLIDDTADLLVYFEEPKPQRRLKQAQPLRLFGRPALAQVESRNR